MELGKVIEFLTTESSQKGFQCEDVQTPISKEKRTKCLISVA
jgi:hypothetical protein